MTISDNGDTKTYHNELGQAREALGVVVVNGDTMTYTNSMGEPKEALGVVVMGGGTGGEGGLTEAEKLKLAGVQPEATKNDTDANLRDRSTHTGTQTASTIIDLPDLMNTKVDAVPGKGLSESNYTQEEKDKLAGLDGPHFKGTYTSLAELQSAGIEAVPGDYADVDGGLGEETFRCIWDDTNGQWVAQLGTSTSLTGAQIKAEYEAQPDTNAFTDDEKALLAAFENRHTWSDKGTWNAATNTPMLLDGTGTPGDFYVVTTPGERSFGSRLYNFELYDWVVFFRGTWQRFATNPKALTWANIAGKPDFAPIPRGSISAPIPALLCQKNANQSLPHNDQQDVTWQTVVYDQFGMKSGNSFIVPAWATHARVSTSLGYDPNGTGYRNVSIQQNGAHLASARISPVNTASVMEIATTTPIRPVTPGTVFTVQAWQNSGAALNIRTAVSTWVQIELFTTN